MLLRTLLPVYQALEAELQRHNGRPLLAGIGRPELYRSSAIEMDLSVLAGPDWAEFLPTLPASLDYAARVTAAAEADAGLLIAHAYTRFLGDLSGGLIMARRLALSLQLQPDALRFFEFPDIVDVRAFKAVYLDALDDAGRRIADPRAIIDEAAQAFLHNIRLSEAVESWIESAPIADRS
jgi:heme oxygenase (biliverdin-producing, ferredoxin)